MRSTLSLLATVFCLFPVSLAAATVPSEAASVPEPLTFVLIGSGLLGLGILRRRRNDR